jgi:hypothetical protein
MMQRRSMQTVRWEAICGHGLVELLLVPLDVQEAIVQTE